MRTVSATRHVAAPPEEVFGYVSDLANLPAWQAGIVSAQQTTAGAVGTGSRAHVVRQLLGQRIAVDITLTEFQPPHRLVLESGASGIDVEAALDLAPDGDGTRLTFSMGIRARNIMMAPLEGMVAGAAEQDLAESLTRVQRHFEPAPDPI